MSAPLVADMHPHISSLFTARLINSINMNMNVRFCLSYDT